MYQTTVEATILYETEDEVDEACCSDGEDKQQSRDIKHDFCLLRL
jgi:hypothetical protein